jgi:hypothetical protein
MIFDVIAGCLIAHFLGAVVKAAWSESSPQNLTARFVLCLLLALTIGVSGWRMACGAGMWCDEVVKLDWNGNVTSSN